MDYSLIFCFDASTGKMHFCISQFSIVCTAACFLEHFISLVLCKHGVITCDAV